MRSTLTVAINKDLLASFNFSCSQDGELAAVVVRDWILQFNATNSSVKVEAPLVRSPRPLHKIDNKSKLSINIDPFERARFRALLSANGNSVSEVVRKWVKDYIEEPNRA